MKLRIEYNNNIKVIALTSHISESEVTQALQAGASAYVIKDIATDVYDDFVPEYKIEITCADEAEQEKLYNKFTEEGYECRILTL